MREIAAELGAAMQDMFTSKQEEDAVLADLTRIGGEVDDLITRIEEEDAAQQEAEEQVSSEDAELHQVMEGLKKMRAMTDAAMAAAKASDKEVENTEKQLAMM